MTRPQVTLARPGRPPTSIAPSAIPAIDPDDPRAAAYASQGRASADRVPAAAEPPKDEVRTSLSKPAPVPAPPISRLATTELLAEEPDDDARHAAVKLPPDTARKLAEIVDRRGSKRTLVALEILAPRIRSLAADHRAGLFPGLPKVSAGAVRASLSLILPREMASDLRFIIAARKAVKAQVLVRLLVPGVAELHAAEFQS